MNPDIIKENVILKEERDDLIKESNRLNGLFMGAVMELNDLKQPWYVKLWNKLPRISIKIERGA